ncbi:cilia- and flagella-associated protein 141 [Eublepharis macularius]|uniref:Cilia- and flagella-associated protein 141 n=1 Tax=Eublepharis macularius TaxID=481883 RepID=A0AA97K0F2_EUBMA|nr:cilia- and flagella-associated protein 141 [Eublepharis macularius]
MAPTKDKKEKFSHAVTQEQLLKEEQMIEKIGDFTKLVRSWERGQAAGLQLAKIEDIGFAKMRQRQQAEMKEELYQANKQLMMVRREALRHLLSVEHLQYQLELNHLGKSFYAERM